MAHGFGLAANFSRIRFCFSRPQNSWMVCGLYASVNDCGNARLACGAAKSAAMSVFSFGRSGQPDNAPAKAIQRDAGRAVAWRIAVPHPTRIEVLGTRIVIEHHVKGAMIRRILS